MGDMGLIFTPVLVRRLLSWTHSYVLQTVLLEGTTHLRLPTCPHTHPTPPTYPLPYARNP